MTGQRDSLFDLSDDGPASRGLRAAPPVSDETLCRDLADAASILAMGAGGMGSHTQAALRGEILAACRELAARWGTDGPA